MDAVTELCVKDHREIRPEILSSPACNAFEVGELQNPTRSLIGQHGVDVAVAHHHRVALQGGPYHRKDVLCLVSCIQQGLSARRHLAGRRIQNNPPDHRSNGRIARFEGPQNLMTGIGQPRTEQIDLGCLADTITALEDNEDPTSRAHAPSFFLVLAHISTNSRRERRTLRYPRSKSRPAAKAWAGRSLATCSAVTSSRR